MIIEIIMLFMLAAAFFQKKAGDRQAAMIFCTPAVAMIIFGDGIPGEYYYALCALLSAVSVCILTISSSRLSIVLAKFMVASIALNLIGFNLWFWYMSPAPYYYGFIIYYVFALYTLSTKGSPMWTYYSGWRQYSASLRSLYARMPK